MSVALNYCSTCQFNYCLFVVLNPNSRHIQVTEKLCSVFIINYGYYYYYFTATSLTKSPLQ